MDVETKAWLADIAQSIREVEGYFLDKPMVFSDFCDDIKTKRAVERNLEIIGEALGRIAKQNPELRVSDMRRIIDARNRIIHGYDSVSN